MNKKQKILIVEYTNVAHTNTSFDRFGRYETVTFVLSHEKSKGD